jgi:hypothetical protein
MNPPNRPPSLVSHLYPHLAYILATNPLLKPKSLDLFRQVSPLSRACPNDQDAPPLTSSLDLLLWSRWITHCSRRPQAYMWARSEGQSPCGLSRSAESSRVLDHFIKQAKGINFDANNLSWIWSILMQLFFFNMLTIIYAAYLIHTYTDLYHIHLTMYKVIGSHL